MSSFTLSTPHGLISIISTPARPSTPTLLLIHGNSSSSKVFRHILSSQRLTSRYRILTFCLPGHGASSKAPDPWTSYHMRGYAQLAIQILQHLYIEDVVVLGWSLGGHIGIEMLGLVNSPESLSEHERIRIRGVMLTGTPPAYGIEQVAKAFPRGLGLAGTVVWSEETALEFSKGSAAADKPELWEEWMYEDAKNTDGRARMIMARQFVGEDLGGVDQVRVVEESDVLIAVVNGAEEQFINLDYIDGIKWKNLWKGKCLRLEGLHHAPFWEDPSRFEEVLVEFMGDVEKE
jgi:pimeloyl-ACP methyl ester carboxylesterase